MKVVYTAGPFRGPDAWAIEQNIRVAETLALEIWRSGKAAVLCPHTNTRFYQGAAPDHVWLEGDLEMLRRCDAVYGLPGCFRSEGAKAEIAEAERLNLPVFYSLGELFWWLDRHATTEGAATTEGN